MKLMGIGDEAANTIDGQIQATKDLGWKFIELRAVEAPGFSKANVHDIPEAAFELAARKLEASGIQVYFGKHMVSVFHDATLPSADDSVRRRNFVEYGRRVKK